MRTYKRKSSRQEWTVENLQRALTDIENKTLSIHEASRTYNIPRPTIQRHRKGGVKTPGTLGRFLRVFDDNFENQLVKYCLDMQSRFYGLSLVDCRKLAFQLAEMNHLDHPFSKEKSMAGKDWVYSFMKRHTELSLREPEPTSLSRATGFNRVQVGQFFDLLRTEMSKNAFTPERIFNVDESGITCVHQPVKVIACKGQKQVGKIVSGERGKNITVVCAVSAGGNYVPPMFIYPRKKMTDRLLVGAPVGAVGYAQEKGWMDSTLFIKWLEHFIKHVKPSTDEKVLLLLDGHVSHKTLLVIEKARECGIVMISFPPHTTHRLQPLDVTFFGPLKRYVREESDKFMVNHVGKRITDYDMAAIFCQAYVRAATMQKAINGFSATGICPFNPDIFTDNDFAGSLATELIVEAPVAQAALSETAPQSPAPPDPTLQSTMITTLQSSVLVESITQATVDRSAVLQPQSPNSSQIISTRISVEQISPLATAGTSGIRKRKAQKSEILTASPYKDRLTSEQEIKNAKEAGRKKKKLDQTTVPKSRKSVKKSSDVSLLKNRPIPRMIQKKKCTTIINEDVKTASYCIYCNELYVSPPKETWMQCSKCKKWCHESCVAPDPGEFMCDFCRQA
jgi:hypothetical protein